MNLNLWKIKWQLQKNQGTIAKYIHIVGYKVIILRKKARVVRHQVAIIIYEIKILRFKMTMLRNQTTAVRYNTIFWELQEIILQLWYIKSLTPYIFYFEVKTGFHIILSCLKVKCVTSCLCFSLLWDVCIPGAVCHLNTDSLARLPSTLRARAVTRSSTDTGMNQHCRHHYDCKFSILTRLQNDHPQSHSSPTHIHNHTTEREHINSKWAQKQVNKIWMQINYYCR